MAASSEALNTVKSTEPTQWLAPSHELSEKSRAALKILFSSLTLFTPKSPFSELLAGADFDAEQIWQQIDVQSQPLISGLRREVKRFEKSPEAIATLKVVVGGEEKLLKAHNETDDDDVDEELEQFDDDEEGDDVEVDEEEDGDDDVDDDEEEDDGEEEDEEGSGNEFEDGFFKVKELGKYLKATEKEEYNDDEGVEGADEGDDDEDDDAQELMNLGEGEDDGDGQDARYQDFFGKKDQDKVLSTHEKEQLKLKAEIEKREKTMLDPKTWTMQGEVTAAKRPQNSALEVDIDFEHNVKPPPPITEEVTLGIEDMIRKRIEQGLFDDVQRAPPLPTKAPRERKEMDETKNTKGLAEAYEQEYVQTINPGSGPLSFKDKQKLEAEMLFKKLCLKLDALSHFHFTPKPVIEDMSIQDNVPALAMEEIAPVAVSDATMLAPEELFSGKGDIKEEAELTQAERKRRRANKKRKFKAVTGQKLAKKPRETNKDVVEANQAISVP